MSEITKDSEIITKSDLAEFYKQILPYLNGGNGIYNNYTTDEQMIGKWIDNRPLYQKTYKKISNPTISDGYYFDIIDVPASFNDKNIVQIFGTVLSDTGTSLPINLWSSENKPHSAAGSAFSATEGLRVYATSSLSGRTIYLTVQYTKKTDAAISYLPYINTSKTNYLLEEQDTGVKWIDGSILYQKTYITTTPSTTQFTKVVDESFANRTVVNMFGDIDGRLPLNLYFNNNVIVTLVNDKKDGIYQQVTNNTNQPTRITVQYIKTSE